MADTEMTVVQTATLPAAVGSMQRGRTDMPSVLCQFLRCSGVGAFCGSRLDAGTP
jgi:hypothetical protein